MFRELTVKRRTVVGGGEERTVIELLVLMDGMKRTAASICDGSLSGSL